MEAVRNSWPSIILIEFRYKLDYEDSGNTFTKTISKTCSGTLINRNTALTAAQCLVESVSFTSNNRLFSFKVVPNNYFPTFESMYTAYIGMHDISGVFSQNLVFPERKVSVMSFIRHPDFDPTDLKNDIAVIKLRNLVSLDSFVQLACLPKNTDYDAGIEVWTAGWGDLSEDRSVLVSFELQNVQITLNEMNECENVAIGFFKDSSKQICAGNVNGGKGVCDGDEGGPLFVRDLVNGMQRFVLVGITSYREGCARVGLPA